MLAGYSLTSPRVVWKTAKGGKDDGLIGADPHPVHRRHCVVSWKGVEAVR